MSQEITNTRINLDVAAELLGKDPRTLKAAFERGEIKGNATANKGIMLHKSSLRKYAIEKSLDVETKKIADALTNTDSGRRIGKKTAAKSNGKASKTQPAPKPTRKPRKLETADEFLQRGKGAE